jgi:flagellar hook-length control protein FliK
MPGEAVVVAADADDQKLQAAAEATSASVTGAPTAPGLGVVPMLAGPLSPASPWTAPAAPTTGQPTLFSLPTAVRQQVFTAISPLLRGVDGSYGLELRLHPRDLGAVQVNVDVRNGEISIQMHATDAAARDALRGGLSDLRQQLEDQGLRAGSMEVGSGGANTSQPETSWARSEGIDEPKRNLVLPDQPVAVAASNTSLDLRM